MARSLQMPRLLHDPSQRLTTLDTSVLACADERNSAWRDRSENPCQVTMHLPPHYTISKQAPTHIVVELSVKEVKRIRAIHALLH